MQSVSQMWQSFRGQAMSPHAPPDQAREMRLAFYAGVWALLTTFREIGEDDVSEDRGVEHLERIKAECETFADGVKSGLV